MAGLEAVVRQLLQEPTAPGTPQISVVGAVALLLRLAGEGVGFADAVAQVVGIDEPASEAARALHRLWRFRIQRRGVPAGLAESVGVDVTTLEGLRALWDVVALTQAAFAPASISEVGVDLMWAMHQVMYAPVEEGDDPLLTFADIDEYMSRLSAGVETAAAGGGVGAGRSAKAAAGCGQGDGPRGAVGGEGTCDGCGPRLRGQRHRGWWVGPTGTRGI